jgi:hypothetical protein
MELLCLHDQHQNDHDHSYQFEKVVDGLGAPYEEDVLSFELEATQGPKVAAEKVVV